LNDLWESIISYKPVSNLSKVLSPRIQTRVQAGRLGVGQGHAVGGGAVGCDSTTGSFGDHIAIGSVGQR
jgi:hypothetical protein